MLQPIKSFFNYLQKNANSTPVSRPTNDLSMTDEMNSSIVEGGESGAFEDPLTDPLAIDTVENVDFTQACTEIVNTVPEKTEKHCVSDFIFVDVEKLKNQNSSDKSDTKHIKSSDINGNHSCVEQEENENNEKVLQKNFSEEKSSNELQNCDVEELLNIESLNQKNHSESTNQNVEETNVLKKETNGSFVTVASSEEDVTDTSGLIEEIRSDGSDSGYAGSDTHQNISAIEKSIASATPGKSSLKRKSLDQSIHEVQPKKIKQGINFGNVTVFYFPRCQGFSCVPTQGGSSLGMTAKHAYKKTFTLAEHANEQRRLHRLKMAGNELNGTSSSSDESKSEDEISENSLSEADSEAYGFLQPVSARQRRAILKAAGVRKIDTTEKDECRILRTSREVCGCTCRSYCDPESCECSLAGIKCQVDRLKPQEFPCGCNRDGCANVNGRIEFNPARVKTHFIHTIMRLELEKRQELSDDVSSGVIQHASSKWWSQIRQSPHTTLTNASSSASYSSYIYNNGISHASSPSNSPQSSQYGTKIPSISTMVTPSMNQESLDLHYAYRDDYTNTLTLNSETNGSAYSSSDYYTTYNYMPISMGSSNAFHSNYNINQTTLTPYHQQSSFSSSSECQYSNYTNGTMNYRIDNDVNSVTTSNHNCNYPTSMHNGAMTSRINYQPVIATLPQHPQSHEILSVPKNACSSVQNSTTNLQQSPNGNSNFNQASNHERRDSNENLSEIIKKSITESVTA